MGVSGVGKSTIGKLLAEELDIPFFDGDDFHTKVNINKMESGQPLNDDDRLPWLKTLNKLAKEQLKKSSCIIACSALKKSYRNILKTEIETQTKWVFLNQTFDLIYNRLKERNEHFMPISLLQSQFDALEAPADAIKLDCSEVPNEQIKQIKHQLFDKSEFGVLGLGVMGKSLARNLASKDFKISIFNRHIAEKEENIALKATNEFKELHDAEPFDDLENFVDSLKTPRKILLMVNAGKPVDMVIEQLSPLLSEGDVIIDGGNSHYKDTQRRIEHLKKQNTHFIGAGISGGKEGALKGPSIMPSGNKDAYTIVQSFLEKIAAKDSEENACCTYIGPNGSGHFIKMIHNGIEYAEMQLLAEVYLIFKKSGKTPDQIAEILDSWQPKVSSYLLEITIDILKMKEGDEWLHEKILDKSGNKGTGSWSTVSATQLGVPSTMIASALFARYTSSLKELRIKTSQSYPTESPTPITINEKALLAAYQFASIINHIQGFQLINEASKSYQWNLNLSEIARIWTNGCIIRSALMEELVELLKKDEDLLNNDSIIVNIKLCYPEAKEIVSQCILAEIPTPCLSAALNFFNGIKTAYSSANMIQAQRDYFGAHRYQRKDDTSGKTYHTNWKNTEKE